MSQSGSWLHGLFDCFTPLDTCCLATWCPCILYGQTQARKEGQEPTSCNGPCMAWAGLCLCLNPAQALLQMSQRGSIRHKYGIDSNGCNDCLLSWCCGCCTLIQEDKEVRSQDERGPMMQQGYGAPNGGQQMVYGQPPQQQIYGDQKTGMQQ